MDLREEKLLLVRNRLRETAFSLNRKVKNALFMHKTHPEWMSLSEVEELKKETELAFRRWKAIEGKVKDDKIPQNHQARA